MNEQEANALISEIEELKEEFLGLLERTKDLSKKDPENIEWVRRLIVANIETVVHEDHTWLGRDSNLDDWIRDIRERQSEGED